MHADLFKYKGHTFITIVDPFSKYAMAQALRDKSEEQTSDAVLNFMGAFGTPHKLITDNGQFKWQMDELDVEIHFTTVGLPRSQGVIERLHNTLMERLWRHKIGNETGPYCRIRQLNGKTTPGACYMEWAIPMFSSFSFKDMFTWFLKQNNITK